ncbi:MAG: nitrilotriacetate monooxygenase [Methylocystaceae bacterium]|nr:MAG: nitrilotriacetate monooxygenase [Methylocystaceae bacterium]
MTDKNRKLRLGAFLLSIGHHIGAWRHPDVEPRDVFRLEHFKSLARLAERAKFDVIFFADNVGLPDVPPELLAKGPQVYNFDPLILQSILSQETQRIGLVATVSTTYLPPYHLARKFATLDHFSNGRAAWNLVTSATRFEAQNFGLGEQLAHADRYDRAREYVQVVRALWDSWEDDAFLFDKQGNRFFDPAKLHTPAHRAKHFSVRGPLQTGRPPQGYPVLVQAGSSEDGQALAAETAEVVFTAQQTFAEAKAFYDGLKSRLAQFGRDPSQLLVLPGVQPIIGRTEEEAKEKFALLQSLVDPEIGVGLLSTFLNFDLSAFPIDGPLPDLPFTEGWQSRRQLFVDLARRKNLSIRELYLEIAGGRGHRTILGTPQSIADQLEEWFVGGAADGFNILAPTLPKGLEDFSEFVIPDLQRRGLFRTEYEGRTLRENLGLARPVNQFAAS